MAVETLYGEFGYHTAAGHGLADNIKVAVGRYNFSTVVVESGDIRKVVRLPARCVVVGGELWAGDLDTGSETLDIDFGWADNGGGSETYVKRLEGASRASPNLWTYTNMQAGAADSDGFFNSGVWTGAGVTNVFAAGNNWRPFPMIAGPVYFSRETELQFLVNAPSATPADKEAWVYVRYFMA